MINTVSSPKKRYDLLDGLRGVAALMVIIYHCFECFPADTWIIGHGYLAVDFFFILSGFVVGYAYDDRWKSASSSSGMTIGGFFKRRLVRLHPMVVFGVILGLITFLIGGGVNWSGEKAATSAIMIAVLLHLFMIPEAPGAGSDVRGNAEMFPLNGPHWSLFFVYIGNIIYALVLRKLPTRVLAAVTSILAACFAAFAISDVVGYGNIGVGWTLEGWNFWGGLLRMLVPFSMGLLLCRLMHGDSKQRQKADYKPILKPANLKGTFWICSLLIIVFLAMPSLGGENTWINCLYEVICVLCVFPIIVWIGVSGSTNGKASTGICSFLGEISYPLYAVHYPTMYLFYSYIGFPETWRTPGQCWPWMVALVLGNIILAYAALKLYDKPVRSWLSKR
ncbi:MAG: acyltransferase [Bacteroidales bacterium]|nr:acyltransferase [Bacteroidales bacterium]